jgi:general secretion pathway protein D
MSHERLLRLPRLGACALAVAWLLAGCAGYQAYRDGQSAIADGQIEQGLAKLKQAVSESPTNVEFRERYFSQRDATVEALLRQAQSDLDSGNFEAARQAYAEILRVDPANVRGADGVDRVEVAQREWKQLEAARQAAAQGDLQGAIAGTREVLSENPDHRRAQQLLKQLMRQQADATGKELGIYPKLKTAYRTPVSLSFSNASLQQVFDALKQASGLNYVFDKDVHTDARVTLAVTAKPVEDILRLLLATNQLDERVLDDDTLLVYPNTPAKQAEYREMVVRTFYLRNAEASKMADVVRTITKAKDVVVDDKLNLLIVRDSANVIRMAEKLIAAEDMPEPEVMLDLEVLEVSTSRLQQLGVTWPSAVSATVEGSTGKAGQLTPHEVRHFNSGLVKLNFNDPLAAAQLQAQVSNADLLANPRIRVRNKQSAKILIGQRVPVFTTTATANIGTSESVNYLDVGLKLDIEPSISLDDEVSMKLALEVSSIIDTVTSPGGTQAYRLGTRNTSTTLEVRDGETNVLAGLIQQDDRHANTGLPWLNEMPVLNKLFGQSQDSGDKTEIVLLVTPHIVRNVELPGVGLQEFMSGTDASVGAAPIQLGTPLSPGAAIQSRPQTPNTFVPAPRPVIAAPNAPAPSPGAPPTSPPPAFTPPPLVPSSPSANGNANGGGK